jgi:hydrophobic/amphiphilic exporter-1 (mainly G- bacteria), HAE1 family
MSLTATAIKRPLTIVMLILGICILGFQSMKRMPIDLMPKVDIPYISIITVYKGASPQEIETQVSKTVEDAVASVNRVKNVTATSQDSISIVTIEFQVGANIDVASQDVRDKLDLIVSDLPDDADDPIIYKIDFGAMPIMYIGMSGKRSPSELKKMAEDRIKDRLGKVYGVASVSITGGDTREIFVKVDQERLKANSMNIMEITQAIAMANLNVPGGTIRQGRNEFSVRIIGEFSNPQELGDLRIKRQTSSATGVVELKDVATVLDTTAQRDQFTRLDGNDSVGIVIQKQSDANSVKVAEGIQKELLNLGKELPQDITISVSRDSSTFVKDALDDVAKNLIEAAILATLVVFVFLHIFRATFIVLLAIPASIFATFLPIYFFGFSLNSITLMGLALCVGILVDDSIVVLENIFRHLQMGKPPAQAALDGRMEIGGAAVAITLTDVVVYVPIAFMGGIVGMFFREFGLTIATATLFSLFMSFTLTPMLASKWLRSEDIHSLEDGDGGGKKGFWAWFFKKFDTGYAALDKFYRGLLTWAIKHKWMVVISGNVILVLSFAILKYMSFEMMPQTDQGQFDVTLEMPIGTNVEETNRVTKIVESRLLDKKKYPEVTSVFSTVGSSGETMMGSSQQGPQYAEIKVRLIDKTGRKKTVWQVESALGRDLSNVAGPIIRIKTTSTMGSGMAPIHAEFTGTDNDNILKYATAVKHVIDNTKGTRDSRISWQVGKPELQVKLDRVKAAQFGLSAYQIAMTVRNSIEGDNSSTYREKGDEYDIRIRLDESNRSTIQDVENIIIGGYMGNNILLKDVANVRLTSGPNVLERKNKQRLITVEAQLAPGYTLGNIVADINKNVASVDKPVGVNLHFGGEAENMNDSFGNMGSAMVLAIVLVYMLMCALFESMLYPFIIMFSLPQALIGALWGLFLFGKSLSMISFIGIIMLVGLVTKNAILLVDYTNTLRKRGMERDAALIEAGPTRLRPILMTTLTVILGNLPIALGLGRGSEMRAPMSVAVIGGLTLSLLLTLLIIPSTYSIVDDIANRISGRKKEALSSAVKQNPPAGGLNVE